MTFAFVARIFVCALATALAPFMDPRTRLRGHRLCAGVTVYGKHGETVFAVTQE